MKNSNKKGRVVESLKKEDVGQEDYTAGESQAVLDLETRPVMIFKVVFPERFASFFLSMMTSFK